MKNRTPNKLLMMALMASLALTIGCQRNVVDSVANFFNETTDAKKAKEALNNISPDTRKIACTTDTFIASYFNAESVSPGTQNQPKGNGYERGTLGNFLELLLLNFRNGKCESFGEERLQQSVVLYSIVDFNGPANSLMLSYHFGWDKVSDKQVWRVLGVDCWKTDANLKFSNVSGQQGCKDIHNLILQYVESPANTERSTIIEKIKSSQIFSEIHSTDLEGVLKEAKSTFSNHYKICDGWQEDKNICAFDRSVYVLQGHGMPVAEPIESTTTDHARQDHAFGPRLEYFAYGDEHSKLQRTTDDGDKSTPIHRRVLFPDGNPQKANLQELTIGSYDRCTLQERVCPYFEREYVKQCLNWDAFLADTAAVAACYPTNIDDIAGNLRKRKAALDLTVDQCQKALSPKHFMFDKESCAYTINFYREKCSKKHLNSCEAYQPKARQ